MKPEVLVFVMEGCGACEQLKPLAQQVAAHYASCVDTRFVDVNQDEAFADAMSVDETPTVIAVDSGKRPVARMVGHDGKPDRLLVLYSKVATSCQVGPFQDV